MADGDELRLELNTGAGEEEDEVVGAAESPSDPLEFDLLSARGDALPWDSPVRAPGAGKSIQASARSGTSVVAASEPIEEWLAPPAEAVESARGDNELEPLGPTFESVRETSPLAGVVSERLPAVLRSQRITGELMDASLEGGGLPPSVLTPERVGSGDPTGEPLSEALDKPSWPPSLSPAKGSARRVSLAPNGLEDLPEPPDLEVRPSRPPGAAVIRPSSSPGHSVRPSVLPAGGSQAPTTRRSQAPSSAGGGSTFEPFAGLGELGGLYGSGAAWEWEDELGDAATAQQNLVSLGGPGDDVPWPACRTPNVEQFAVDPREAERVAGFGPAAKGFFAAPLYYLRGRPALQALKEREDNATKSLRAEERRRDSLLAGLAASLRADLAADERLSRLYQEVVQVEGMVREHERSVQSWEAEDRSALSHHEEAESRTTQQIAATAEQASRLRTEDETAERELQRARARAQRMDIELRNVEAQARALVPEGASMPPPLGERYLELSAAREQAQSSVELAKKRADEAAAAREAAEENERRARAEQGRFVAAREGMAVLTEGESALRGADLRDAEGRRQELLSAAGLAIMELHGEVRVPTETLRQLLASDLRVKDAARRLFVIGAARSTLDEDAWRAGRRRLVGLSVLLLVALAWVVSRLVQSGQL